jgi:uncharacterized repeat protein (TIGR01451 family)
LFSPRSAGAICAIALFLVVAPDEAHAVGVAAGTDIVNTAQVSYAVGATNATATSNTVTVKVAEILDVAVTRQSPNNLAATGGETQREIVFIVTNSGNGAEAFHFAMTSVIGGDDFDPTPATPSIYFDTDASGDLSAGDTAYSPGVNDPLLNADASITVLVVNDIPAAVIDGNVGISRLSADARTGTGAPGTVYAGQGAGGTDAVVGTSGADADASGQYLITGITVNASKTQTVVDQFGGTRPVPGARIDYSIVVTATGTGSAAGAVFIDNVPDNTTYVPGSLRLNSVALSDGADVDAGVYETTPDERVRVQLGNVTSVGSQTIQFSVTIN